MTRSMNTRNIQFLLSIATVVLLSTQPAMAFTFNGKKSEDLKPAATETTSHTQSTPSKSTQAPAKPSKTSASKGFTINGKPLQTTKSASSSTPPKASSNGDVDRTAAPSNHSTSSKPHASSKGWLSNVFGGSSKSKSSTQSNTRSQKFDGSVNINTATAAQLAQLNGIGPAKAAQIISYRRSHGKFKSVKDLAAVNGIGDATVAKIARQATVN